MKQKTEITEKEIYTALEKIYEDEFKITYNEYQLQYKLLKNMVGDQQRKNNKAKPYKMFISAPFGNHIKHPNAISVTGTWTLAERKGLFKNILKTLRWNSEFEGWTNRLGLPNKGIGAVSYTHLTLPTKA